MTQKRERCTHAYTCMPPDTSIHTFKNIQHTYKYTHMHIYTETYTHLHHHSKTSSQHPESLCFPCGSTQVVKQWKRHLTWKEISGV